MFFVTADIEEYCWIACVNPLVSRAGLRTYLMGHILRELTFVTAVEVVIRMNAFNCGGMACCRRA